MRSCAMYTRKRITCLRFFRLFVVQRATGQRRPLLKILTGRLMLPAHRWKRKWHVASCSWYVKLGTLHTKNFTCLRIVRLFVAQKAIGKRLPFLQLKTSRLMFPALRWKRPPQLITSGWDAKGSSFTTANKHLFADLLLFGSGEGDEAASPSLATENDSIDASSPSLEAPIATYYTRRGMQTGAVSQRQTNTCLPIFCYLRVERARR